MIRWRAGSRVCRLTTYNRFVHLAYLENKTYRDREHWKGSLFDSLVGLVFEICRLLNKIYMVT